MNPIAQPQSLRAASEVHLLLIQIRMIHHAWASRNSDWLTTKDGGRADHRVMQRAEKSRSWTQFWHSNKERRKKVSYTAETTH
jgi:hypothetical protein